MFNIETNAKNVEMTMLNILFYKYSFIFPASYDLLHYPLKYELNVNKLLYPNKAAINKVTNTELSSLYFNRTKTIDPTSTIMDIMKYILLK